MLRKISHDNFDGICGLVNALAVFVTVGLIGAGYFSAIGSFTGLA